MAQLVARLTPDQKVACSSHVGVIWYLHHLFWLSCYWTIHCYCSHYPKQLLLLWFCHPIWPHFFHWTIFYFYLSLCFLIFNKKCLTFTCFVLFDPASFSLCSRTTVLLLSWYTVFDAVLKPWHLMKYDVQSTCASASSIAMNSTSVELLSWKTHYGSSAHGH